MGFGVKGRRAVLIDSGTEPFARAVAGILPHPWETRSRYLRVRSIKTT